MKNKKISFIIKVGIFSALSIVLYYLRIQASFIPFFPSFLKFQFSNVPAIMSGFILGPIGGCLVILTRTVINLIFTQSMFVGELADFIIGVIVVLTTSLYYKRHRTLKGGIISLVFGVIAWCFSGVISNTFILIPTYMKVYHLQPSYFMNLLSFVKNINENNFMFYYNLIVVIPFNLMLSLMVSLVVMLIYKRTSNVFKYFDKEKNNDVSEN